MQKEGIDTEVRLDMDMDGSKYRLTFEMPEELHDSLRETAHALNLDRSKVIRKALVLGLAQLRGLPTLAQFISVGLIKPSQ